MKRFIFVGLLYICLSGQLGIVALAAPACTEGGEIISQNEAPPEGIDMSYVADEATKRLKEKGYQNIPEIMNMQLESGMLAQEDYDIYFPTAGAGYIDWVCYVEELTVDSLIESIIGQVEVSSGYNAFYIGDFKGYSSGGSVIFRIYRATIKT